MFGVFPGVPTFCYLSRKSVPQLILLYISFCIPFPALLQSRHMVPQNFKICHTTAKDRLFTYISRTLFRCVFHTILHRTIQLWHFILLFLSDLLEDHVKILCSRFCWHAKSILFCFLKWYKKHPLTLRSEVIAGEERYGHNYKFINMGRPAN